MIRYSTLAALFGLVLGLIPFQVNASEDSAKACSAPDELVYAATFNADANPGKMRLIIGHAGHAGNAGHAKGSRDLVAQIWSQENGAPACQALCELKTVEAESTYLSQAVHLECRSTRMSALTSSMTILWPEKSAPKAPQTIRFGNWIRGYEHAPLLVEMDHFQQIQEGRRIAQAN